MDTRLTDLNITKEAPPIFIDSQFLKWIFPGETTFQYLKEGESIDFLYPWLLYKILLNPLQETETQTSSIEVNYGYIYHFTTLTYSIKKKRDLIELEHEALLNVAMEFSRIEKVKSIYFQRYRGEIQVHILLSITQYESDLMDNLLDIEYDIRKRYPELTFEFFYPPAGISEKKDFIHPKAQCIYIG